MLGNKPSEISARNFKHALSAWISSNDLERAVSNRPTVVEYENMLSESSIVRGGFAGFDADQGVRVSVVLPLWNCAETLEETLGSIWAQKNNAEIIIVDGVSTDGTMDIVQSHRSKIAAWVSEPDESMYDAINKGIALATGNVVKILNGDDCLASQSISLAVDHFESAGFDACFRGALARTNQETGEVVEMVGGADRARMSPDFYPILHPSWYVPKSIYDQVGLYLPYFRIAGDYEFFAHLHAEGIRFVTSDKALVTFRMGGMSAGLVGLHEGLEIDSHYLGRARALAMYSEMAWKKNRYKMLEKIVGDQNAEVLWHKLKKIVKKNKYNV